MAVKEKIMFDKTEFVFTDTYGKRVATFNVTWEMIQSIYFDNCKVSGFFSTKPSQRITIIMRHGAPLMLLSCKEKTGFDTYLDGLRKFAKDNRISLFDTLDDPEPHSPIRAKL